MKKLQIYLRALNFRSLEAWRQAFRGAPQISISQGDIFGLSADAVISPANSFGYMDGGIDLIYSQFFGWDVEERLRNIIIDKYDGEIPVGQAEIVATNHEKVPFLISAPTMRVPMNVAQTAHAYLAFRAALRVVRDWNLTAVDGEDAKKNPNQRQRINSILCPGLCTGEGRMPYDRSARQMRAAYDNIVNQQIEKKGGLAQAVRNHIYLVQDGD
jgi:O-acetyl-ADP-ribose deacetylase (regulator of RNase III)